MRRLTRIDAEYSSEIADAATRFGDHEGITPATILRWLDQFGDDHLPLACKVLGSITYYAASNIRAMTRELVQIVLQEFGRDPARITYVPVGRQSSGSAIIMRVLQDLQETRGSRIVTMSDLVGLRLPDSSALVFVDDFSGTGNHLVDWWQTVESLVRPVGGVLTVALLVLGHQARTRIEEFAAQTLCVDELDSSASVYSDLRTDFDANDKENLLAYSRKTECGEQFVKGYGSCGLLVAFKHGCPNNSLPILWCDSKKWHSLFRRRAI